MVHRPAHAEQNGSLEQLVEFLSVPRELRSLKDSVTRREGDVLQLLDGFRGLEKQVVGVASGVGRQHGSIAELEARLARTEHLLTQIASRSVLLEEASRHQALLAERHYAEHVIDPLVRQLIPLIDLLDAAIAADGSIDGNGVECMRGTRSQLVELLAQYGVDIIAHSEGSLFNPKLMKPVRTFPAAGNDQDKLIAESVQIGFARGEQIIRHQAVAVYVFQAEGKE